MHLGKGSLQEQSWKRKSHDDPTLGLLFALLGVCSIGPGFGTPIFTHCQRPHIEPQTHKLIAPHLGKKKWNSWEMKSDKTWEGPPKVVCLSSWTEELRIQRENQTRTLQYTHNYLLAAFKNNLILRLNTWHFLAARSLAVQCIITHYKDVASTTPLQDNRW